MRSHALTLRTSLSLCLQVLASDMLANAAEVAKQQFLPSRQRFFLTQTVIITLVEQGTLLLEAKDADALGLLDNAYNLITGHLVSV